MDKSKIVLAGIIGAIGISSAVILDLSINKRGFKFEVQRLI